MHTLPVLCIILTLVTIAEFLSLYKPNSDVCSLPKVVGPCRAAFRKYFYNKKTGLCERFIYGGCGGNKNNFATLQKCKEACDLPFYPSIKPKHPVKCGPVCRIFCPNGNVPDKNGCPTCQCIPDKPNSDVCSLPKVVGPCRAAFRSYFYNKKTGRCERFIYGGCGGNKNNFNTLQKCKEACGYSRGKLIRFPM